MRLNLLLLFVCIQSLFANDVNQTQEEAILSKGQKVILTNVAMGAVIATWGISQWEYGTEETHAGDEGWFGKETSNGGSDKLGHFYTNYLLTRIFSPLFESWGYTRDEAALYGAITAGIQSIILIEVGDSTSKEHGFSYEDALMDLLGSVIGYIWETNPSISNKIDFRVEYLPDFSQKIESDFTTDYESMKHLMAIKAEGFELFKNSYAKYLELHFGYYTRNFHHNSVYPIEDRERYFYAGIGINLSKLTRPVLGKYSQFFNYYQTPYTYISYDKEWE